MKPPFPTPQGPRLLLAALLASVLVPPPGALSGQQTPTGGPLPAEVREEVFRFLNDPGTLRAAGGTRVPAGTRIVGPIGVLGGGLRVAGTVEGPVVVANGDLVLDPGGRVEGAVLVVGGRVDVEAAAQILGEIRSYGAPLRFRVRGDRVEPDELPGRDLVPFLQADLGFGVLRPVLRSAGNYNRTEGLPVHVGPLFRSGGRNPTQVEAYARWRSASGLEIDRDELGHFFGVDQELGGSGEARIGFQLHSETRPMETMGLSDTEASLTSFFLHRDFRDYFESAGWSVHLELSPANRPIRARFEYREEDHETAEVRSPWTLRDQQDPWRPLPLVAEGPARSISFDLEVDTRDDARDPSTGWWAQGELRRRVGGELRLPTHHWEEGSETHDAETSAPYPLATDATIDLRRYNRLGPDTRLNLRLFLSGALGGNPLPPQFQRVLGGEGSLPGHPRFSIDCGARSRLVSREGAGDAHPAYGCDRVGLFQVELMGALPFSWSPDPDRHGDWEAGSLLELRPSWAIFLGAGRGRAIHDPALSDDFRRDSGFRADAGAGLFVGPFGLYWAHPLHRDDRGDRGLNFFLRLDHRF